jgi:hypothetical protein
VFERFLGFFLGGEAEAGGLRGTPNFDGDI